jgi:hypothetical protein
MIAPPHPLRDDGQIGRRAEASKNRVWRGSHPPDRRRDRPIHTPSRLPSRHNREGECIVAGRFPHYPFEASSAVNRYGLHARRVTI